VEVAERIFPAPSGSLVEAVTVIAVVVPGVNVMAPALFNFIPEITGGEFPSLISGIFEFVDVEMSVPSDFTARKQYVVPATAPLSISEKSHLPSCPAAMVEVTVKLFDS
jgi:hypothetical protein